MSRINDGLYSSNDHTWETPKGFFKKLNEVFDFDIDLAASAGNTKCVKYFDEEMDALNQKWKGMCFVNPPYGAKISGFCKKAYESCYPDGKPNAICEVVALLPARTDTKYFQQYVLSAGFVIFLSGRMKFGVPKEQYKDRVLQEIKKIQAVQRLPKDQLIREAKKRVENGSAPFPTCLVYYGPHAHNWLYRLNEAGFFKLFPGTAMLKDDIGDYNSRPDWYR